MRGLFFCLKLGGMSEHTHITVTWNRLNEDCRALALALLEQNLINTELKGFIALARGGLSVAQLLGNYLNIRRIESITVISYDLDNPTVKLDESKLAGRPSPDIGDGTGWIVVDDLVDTGGSYRFVKQMLPNATFVALYAKPKGKPDAALTLTTFPQESWLDFPWEQKPII